MSPLILILFVALFAHDAVAAQNPDVAIAMSDGLRLALILAPKLFLGFVYQLICQHYRRRIGCGDGQRILGRFDWIALMLRAGLLGLYVADLFVFGALNWVRRLLFDVVLIDEIIVMLPTLLLSVWMWVSFYGLDRQIRESSLMRQLDASKPVYIMTRGQFLLSQIRHQWALMGVPLFIIVGWTEFVETALITRVSEAGRAGLLLAGTTAVFLFTPLIMRFIWDTVPLPAGEMRTMLADMCKLHRVGVRDLLLWRTFGGITNGAVMGLFRPLRYILLTDALLESMPVKQVEAVMAHELAHVRKHHMFWMLVIAGAAMQVLQWSFNAMLAVVVGVARQADVIDRLSPSVAALVAHPDALPTLTLLMTLAGWHFVFGWTSRRFEEQADTFAVQHLAREWHAQRRQTRSDAPTDSAPVAALPSDAPSVVVAESTIETRVDQPIEADRIPVAAADVMAEALQTVARLNAIPEGEPRWYDWLWRYWRHDPITWRQAYVRRLSGQPIETLAINQKVFRIQVAGIVLLLAAVVLQMWG